MKQCVHLPRSGAVSSKMATDVRGIVESYSYKFLDIAWLSGII